MFCFSFHFFLHSFFSFSLHSGRAREHSRTSEIPSAFRFLTWAPPCFEQGSVDCRGLRTPDCARRTETVCPVSLHQFSPDFTSDCPETQIPVQGKTRSERVSEAGPCSGSASDRSRPVTNRRILWTFGHTAAGLPGAADYCLRRRSTHSPPSLRMRSEGPRGHVKL